MTKKQNEIVCNWSMTEIKMSHVHYLCIKIETVSKRVFHSCKFRENLLFIL